MFDQARSKRWILASAAVSLSAISGCSFSPRNNDRLAHSTSSFTWAGATPVANQVVFVEVFDNTTSSWANDVLTNAAAFTSNSVWQTDAVGTNWFNWTNTITAPNSPRLWKTSSAHTLRAQLRTKQLDVISGNTTMLAMFDAGDAANACMSANQSGGGVQIITACRNPDPNNVVNMFAPCGTLGEACCDGQCDSGMSCDGGSRSSLGLCKQSAGSSCTGNADCVSGTSCVGGFCSIPCTLGKTCTAPNAVGECANGTVTSCTPTKPICAPSSPKPEVCDNKDNDCNGRRDDGIAPTSCQTQPSGCSDRGSSFKVPGNNVCSAGRLTCQPITADYCTACGGSCGECVSLGRCTSDHDCAPNSVCNLHTGFCSNVNQSTGIPLCPNSPGCWLPSERGGTACLP